VGLASAANAIERREGFFAGGGAAFQQAEVFEDGGDKNRAQVNVQTAITKYPDLDALLGLWSYNAPRIAEEVGKSPEVRKRVTVVTFDLDEQAVGHLEGGRIDATVVQNPYEMGYQGVRLLKAYLSNDAKTIAEMLPGGATSIDTGVRIIVPTTDSPVKGENVIDVKSMKAWLAAKGLKSS
jgi:ribose transport system substrate-binding protein